jgi:membrane-associated phospholipid phosphatase
MPGCEHPEASFPSSHTMIVCVIMGSTMMLMKNYIKNNKMRFVLQIICVLIITVTVVGRLISSVHWFTDIIGGILISTMLLAMYSGIMEKMGE